MKDAFHIIELAQLEPRYAHTRIRRKDALLRMAGSIERFGQISPVGVVAENDNRYVLIDGYLRAGALRRCGRDTIKARVLAKDIQTALIEVLSQSRRWDAIEQAGILRELNSSMGLSQAKIAALLGKQKSWVSRRLSLLEVLSDDLLKAVFSAKISTWAACRVLVPLARANVDHAKRLVESLDDQPLSSRDFALFYAHYKEANRKVRENMVSCPHLFLKAVESRKEDREAKSLRTGPEGQWIYDMGVVSHILTRLIKKVATVFYPGQKNLDQRALSTAFSEARQLFSTLTERVNDEIRRTSPDHDHSASAGLFNPQDLKDAKRVPEHDPGVAAG